VPALRPQIDHVIGRFDYIQVMFDQQHRVARVHQAVQRLQQALDVRQVQPGCRLIENVDRVPGALELAELGGDFDTLRLAAGERRRGLAQRQVTQAQIAERFDLLNRRRPEIEMLMANYAGKGCLGPRNR
jgi:hypothetical protein